MHRFLILFHEFLLQVDSANKRGSLLEVVQVLTDMNLIIRRAYISSDGEWFMDGRDFLFFLFYEITVTFWIH